MSTKGSLIIRKNNTDKELFIPADANPEISGRDAIRMAKSLDLNALYDLLVPEDELAGTIGENEAESGEPRDFSLRMCVASVRSGQPYVYRQTERGFIWNSLFCEYKTAKEMPTNKVYPLSRTHFDFHQPFLSCSPVSGIPLVSGSPAGIYQ